MPLPTDQFQVNLTNISNTQNSPHVGTLFDGRQVVVWKDIGTSNSSIRFKIYNADGTPATSELEVNPGQGGFVGSAGGDDYLSISGLVNGGFVVAWQHRALPTADENIFYRVFDATGNGGSVLPAHANAGQPNSNYTQGNQQFPDVTWTDTGFTLAWEDTNTTIAPSRTAIVNQAFDLNGAATSGVYLVDGGVGNNGSPDISYADGRVNNIWYNSASPRGAFANESGLGALGNYRADGTGVTSNFVTDPSSAYGLNAAGTGLDLMSVWVQFNSLTSIYEIRGSFNGDGANSFRINTVDTTTSVPSPNVVGLAGGGWLVVWSDGGSDLIGGTDFDVVGQYYNADRQKVGSEFVITSDAVVNNNLNSLDVDFLPQGGAMVSWEAGGPASSSSEIFARYLPGPADTRTTAVVWNGSSNGDYYYGTAFDDDLRSGGGVDRIYGNGGNDFLQGGLGNDFIDGGTGRDILSFYDLPNGVNVTLSETGSGTAVTASGTDTYSGIEGLAGSDVGAFSLDQTTGADTLRGNSSDNILQGYWGNDQLFGNGGADSMDGGFGNDLIDGGTGVDTALYGNVANFSVKFGSTAADLTLRTIYGDDRLVNVESVQFTNGTRSTATLAQVFADPIVGINSFGANPSAGGWTSDTIYHRELADVNGDNRADIVGFGGAGTFVALARADGSGTFGNPFFGINSFGFDLSAGGWGNNDRFPRTLGDVNGDGRDDIIGFGGAATFVALAKSDNSGTFNNPIIGINSFGADLSAGGWSSDTIFHRETADVNGDGRDDIIGFGGAGTYVALAKADNSGTFNQPFFGINSFGTDAIAGGWSNNDRFPRTLADVNGDGRADIVGFGAAATYVALAKADNSGTFADPIIGITSFGTDPNAGGWSSDTVFHRELADFNGDGRADIVGFGGAGTYVALARNDGSGTFLDPVLAIDSYGYSAAAGGWASNDLYPRTVADVTGDGKADIVGFGGSATYVSAYNPLSV